MILCCNNAVMFPPGLSHLKGGGWVFASSKSAECIGCFLEGLKLVFWLLVQKGAVIFFFFFANILPWVFFSESWNVSPKSWIFQPALLTTSLSLVALLRGEWNECMWCREQTLLLHTLHTCSCRPWTRIQFLSSIAQTPLELEKVSHNWQMISRLSRLASTWPSS